MVEHYLEQPTIWLFLHSIIILSELKGSEKGITHHRSELDIDGSRKRKNFFRLALRACHDYVLPNHTFEENLTVQEKWFFFRFALRAHHDNVVSNQHSERPCSLKIKKRIFFPARATRSPWLFSAYITHFEKNFFARVRSNFFLTFWSW